MKVSKRFLDFAKGFIYGATIGSIALGSGILTGKVWCILGLYG